MDHDASTFDSIGAINIIRVTHLIVVDEFLCFLDPYLDTELINATATLANLTLVAGAIGPMGTLASNFLIATLLLPLIFVLGERQNLEKSLLAA